MIRKINMINAKKGMSTGAFIGIVIAVIVLGVMLAIIVNSGFSISKIEWPW
jgi:hypothetical protein